MALPLWVKDGHLEVAIGDPSQFKLLDEYRIFFGKPIRPVLVDAPKLSAWIKSGIFVRAQSASALMEEMEREGEVEKEEEILIGEDLLDNPQAAPMVRFVNSLLVKQSNKRRIFISNRLKRTCLFECVSMVFFKMKFNHQETGKDNLSLVSR